MKACVSSHTRLLEKESVIVGGFNAKGKHPNCYTMIQAASAWKTNSECSENFHMSSNHVNFVKRQAFRLSVCHGSFPGFSFPMLQTIHAQKRGAFGDPVAPRPG